MSPDIDLEFISVSATQERLFKKFKSGDGGALIELLENERPTLYDYLFRMSGNMSRSTESINDTFEGLSEEVFAVVTSWQSLRVYLYQNARMHHSTGWGADTSKLIHVGLEGPQRDESLEKQDALLNDLIALDRVWRETQSMDREMICLRFRAQFNVSEIAKILNISEIETEAAIGVAEAKILPWGRPLGGSLDVAVGKLPLHPLPVRSHATTVNLTDVMRGIRTRPAFLHTRLTVLFGLLLAAMAAFWYMNPDATSRLVYWFTQPRPTKQAPIVSPSNGPPGIKEKQTPVPLKK